MLKQLKNEIFKANLYLVKHGLVLFTWGNVSGIDRDKGLIVIKPSGMEYDVLTANDMVVVDLNGNIVEGELKPSSDTLTHIQLYKSFLEIGSVAHSHSTYATAWAQAGKNIPILGTTQADYFCGDVPCTRDMTSIEIESAYELETGNVIVETFKNRNPMHIPGVIVKNHGPFTWGKNAADAVYNSVVLEEIAKTNSVSLAINPLAKMNKHLTNKHFNRKHGKNAYYGQNK